MAFNQNGFARVSNWAGELLELAALRNKPALTVSDSGKGVLTNEERDTVRARLLADALVIRDQVIAEVETWKS